MKLIQRVTYRTEQRLKFFQAMREVYDTFFKCLRVPLRDVMHKLFGQPSEGASAMRPHQAPSIFKTRLMIKRWVSGWECWQSQVYNLLSVL